MQIRLTDISLDKVVKALEDQGFGLVTVSCETRRQVETVSIWSQMGSEGPQGYEIGLLRREMTSFARYELVLETNRLAVDRVTDLIGRIANENR